MLHRLKNKIGIILTVLVVFVMLLPITVNATNTDDNLYKNSYYKSRATLIRDKEKTVGRTIWAHNGHNDGVINLMSSDDHVYCVEHLDSSQSALYTIKKYIRIEGNRAYDKGSDNTNYVQNNRNLALAYLLSKGSYSTYYNPHDMTRTRAIHSYLCNRGTWYEVVGKQFKDNDWPSSWMKNYNSTNSDVKNFIKEAEQYYRDDNNKYPTMSVNKTQIKTTMSKIGPIKLNFTGKLEYLNLYNNNSQITSGVTYQVKQSNGQLKTVTLSQIESGDEVYILNSTGANVTSIKTRSTNTVLKAEMWFLDMGNDGQKYMCAETGTSVVYSDERVINVVPSVTEGTITIKKVDTVSGNRISNPAKFKIYASLEDGTKGWLRGGTKGNSSYSGLYTYNGTESNAKEYETINGILTLENLKLGKYTIYETEAPDGYLLEVQTNYNETKDWVPCGDMSISEASNYKSKTIQNTRRGKLTIYKKDANSKANLEGARFIIYKRGSGYLKGTKAKDYEFVSSIGDATRYRMENNYYTSTKSIKYPVVSETYGKGLVIEGLINGTYHIYETKTPDNSIYPLSMQEGYKEKKEGDTTYKYVDTGREVVINSSERKYNTGVIIKNAKEKKGKMVIYKIDSNIRDSDGDYIGLEGARFKIKVGSKGDYWLKGTDSSSYNYKASYEDATKYTMEDIYSANDDITYPVNSANYGKGLMIDGLDNNEYFIYEVEAPEDYILEAQPDYHAKMTVNGQEVFRKHVHNENWKVEITEDAKSVGRALRNKDTGSLTIYKRDADVEDTSKSLTGAGFKIKTSKGWLKNNTAPYVYDATFETATIYKMQKDYDNSKTIEYPHKSESYGNGLRIEGLKEGTYKVFEVIAPTGYYLDQQYGYKKETVTIKENGKNKQVTREYAALYNNERKISFTEKNDTTGKNVALAFTNKKSGSLTIYKYDSDDTGKQKTGLVGAGFKIKTSKGWLKGTEAQYAYDASFKDATTYYLEDRYGKSKTITYPVKSDEYDNGLNIDGLKDGEYYIYEVKAPNGYVLESQNNYIVENGMQYVHNSNWKREIPHTNEEGKTIRARGISIRNVKTGSLTIYKLDENDASKNGLNAGFKIKTSKGWLKNETAPYVYDATFENATTYYIENKYGKSKTITYPVESKDYGNGLKIDGLLKGTYKAYEVKAPNGYSLSEQKGYKKVTVKINGKEVIREYADIGNNERTISFTESNDTTGENCVMVLKNNKNISIDGYVWIDEPPTKTSTTYNSKYDSSRETTLEGVKVQLINKSTGKAVVTGKNSENKDIDYVTTDSKGEYVFKNLIKYSELENYYVKFDYSVLDSLKVKYKDASGNEKEYTNYIPVAFNATATNGSKALMKKITKKDINLSGVATTFTGANTEKNKDAIGKYGLYKCGTWKPSISTISNINLGIKKIKDADYNLTQNLSYVKIDINGYTFTYNYGSLGDNSMVIAPTTNWQKKGTISGYTADIYPSDIAYSVAQTNNNKRIKVYVVYRIDITNTTKYNIPELYKEEEKGLKISSLNNYYDGNRYTLEKTYNLDNNNNVTKDFDDWSNPSNTTRNGKKLKVTTYNLNKYKNGVDKDKTITSFIEFRVKDDAIKKILENPNGIIEEYPTEAESVVYHEYTRKDYSWDLNISKDNQSHITPNDTRSSAAPYLIFREHKEKERTINGQVFEDKAPDTENAVNVEKLGDGVYNSNENVVQGVKVDLIEVPSGVTDLRQLTAEQIKNLQPATRYQKNASGTPQATNNTIITDKGGNYSLAGVVPGKYFLRFTYGDGTQKICNTSGDEIKTIVGKDYKSTIVKETNAKAALNGGTKEEWYKDMDDKVTASVALDNLNTRKVANEAAEGKSDVMASTAKMSVTIENDKTTTFDMPKNTSSKSKQVTLADSKDTKETIYAKYLNTIKAENTFNGLSFGIVEVPKQEAEIQKLITNVRLTNTQGNVLYNGNPEKVESQGVVALSDLDNTQNGGSTYVRAEMQEESLYGTSLELTYEVKITNKSDINYYNNEYYWFGEKNVNKEVTLTPTDVKDYLDETLTYVEEKSDKDRIASNGTKTITVENNKSVKAEELNLKGKEDGGKWTALYTNKITKRNANHPTSDKVKIVAQRILSNQDDDMEVVSRAEIKEINHTPDPNDKTATEPQKIEQIKIAPKEVHTNGMVKATFTITPPTGENRSITSIYVIAGIMSLIILSTGIVIIKKKAI